MRKVLFITAMTAILLVACNGKTKEKKAAEAAQAAEIQRIDSVTAEIDSIKNVIDSAAVEVDELINEL